MTKFILSILFVSGFAASSLAGEAPTSVHKVKTTESKIEWTARKVTGKHVGTINVKEGMIEVNDGIMTKASVTIDMTSITSTDLSGEYKSKLEGHLKSDDFFGVDKYPTAQIVTTNVIPIDEGDYKITADLTIRGITHPITFDAQVIPDGKKYRAFANLVIDRSKYDVKYGSGSFFEDLGDNTIYDEFDLAVSLVIE